MGLKTSELIEVAVRAAKDKKATDPVIMDLRGISSVTDYFVICSGRSDANVKAIANTVEEKLREAGLRPFGIEGRREGTWILMDYVDFVLHIFHHEKRLNYSLEELWKDAKRVVLAETA